MSKLQKPWYIVIEGAIGVGKTTLARMLGERFDTHLILEVFEENPFLARFYESRERYAFQTQMFFLLSRYRQQQHRIRPMLGRQAIIADYMFAKDRLFARLNLGGDEWDIYAQLHSALTEQIPRPDLIIYLQAETDVLMRRIAQRDRPYERDMDRTYIDDLRQAYEDFFADFQAAPVLPIDTNPLNFVARPADFEFIVERVRSALREGIHQPSLPDMSPTIGGERLLQKGSPLADFQKFHTELDRIKGFETNIYFNYIRLCEEIGELGSELATSWKRHGQPDRVSFSAPETAAIGEELADCLAYLLKIANYAGIDLEQAYLQKMRRNQERKW
ncbi:MAG TPA: hypothetical protein ENJ52_09400 [Aliiroseovarius sp.]|nr:hypothetical protein [Aliiroseovarius sp.]